MKKLRKNLIKPFIALVVILSVAINFNIFASAEVYKEIIDTRIADTPTIKVSNKENDLNYTNIGGFSIGKNKNSMFVVKSRGIETDAVLYYYPDISNASKYATFTIPDAGHANSMAIDAHNIYISAWKLNEKNNYIIRIKRSKIADMPFNKNRAKISNDNNNYKKLNTYYKTYNKSTGKYSYSLTGEISAIANYNGNGTFITRSSLPNDKSNSNYFIYSMAKIDNYNGKEALIVERSESSTFLVEDNFSSKDSIGQDIYYLPSNGGLYIPRWFKNDPSKNIIAWAHLNGSYSFKTINGFKLKCYTPDKINVNKTSEKAYGIKKYEKYEIESIAFTKNNDLLYSCNIEHTKKYENEYKKRNNKKKPSADGIFKLTQKNGKKFIWLFQMLMLQ